jgi:hypothetical protein
MAVSPITITKRIVKILSLYDGIAAPGLDRVVSCIHPAFSYKAGPNKALLSCGISRATRLYLHAHDRSPTLTLPLAMEGEDIQPPRNSLWRPMPIPLPGWGPAVNGRCEIKLNVSTDLAFSYPGNPELAIVRMKGSA